MDVCVCGAQSPFSRGGAELHMDNLVEAFRAEGHRADLVRLPVAWERGRLFDSALAWRLVPLDADLVVATNFPSYYVRHPRKVVWLFHQHRGAYDAAGAEWSDFDLSDDSLEDQRLLSDWDARVLEEAVGIYTTSKLVADRLAQYNGLRAEPLYHPPPLYDSLHEGDFGEYVFCATRLEANKRPLLTVEALAHTKSDLGLRIAGTGSLEQSMRKRIQELKIADRVTPLGFIDDSQLIDQYSNAFAVIYTPYEEDYGYVTLQGFYAGKPVITTKDAGGVLEWVEDGVTGIVAEPRPESVAEAIDALASDPPAARRMGAKGKARAEELTWRTVIGKLTSK